jgi:hypothetical protein
MWLISGSEKREDERVMKGQLPLISQKIKFLDYPD